VPLLRSLGRVFRYHLGTIAFGSFIVALIQLIRIVYIYNCHVSECYSYIRPISELGKAFW
jgi:hypothetical protein